MDAWVGLWFWPLDTGQSPPNWEQWLQVAEELIRPDERHGLEGQLDLFDDLSQLLYAEESEKRNQTSVAELKRQHPWLDAAVGAARREGAWHWDLEFAPVFQKGGGFDLQVGNPPWVRPRWYEDLVLAEVDPWWGINDRSSTTEQRHRRSQDLTTAVAQGVYLAEVASSEGVGELLGSPVARPVLAGVQTNLYMTFMDTAWRNSADRGVTGLIHPESHFVDPKAGALRRSTFERLRRHWQFANALFLFEDINDKTVFGVHVYGSAGAIQFWQASYILQPDVLDRSLLHDGGGEPPSIQHPNGGWDLRPHRSRVVSVDEGVLASWAQLFDEPGTPAAEARLLRPVTIADLEALMALAKQPKRLADSSYSWTPGWHEKSAKTDGTIEWQTGVAESWGEVILQGPHFSVATPFNKQPNENCQHNQDYSEWDLEALPARAVPRTNYQRACDRDEYESGVAIWDGRPATDSWRLTWRRMTQPGLERSLHAALLPPGPSHVNTIHTLAAEDRATTALMAGLWASLPFDYLVKVSGKGDVHDELARRFPLPAKSSFQQAVLLRALRLNCLTADYAPLWEELFDPAWQQDKWTDPALTRLKLGDIGPNWTMDTPLRRDQDRWQALVEIDALAALMLGLSADQLCAMYRTQFAVLRKYEHKMVFDAEGRKMCGYHQSAGFRQSQLQEQAKAGDLPKEWSNLWKLYEQYKADPTSVDWLGHYTPPFTPANREAAMSRACGQLS